jgi:hypothetical protein
MERSDGQPYGAIERGSRMGDGKRRWMVIGWHATEGQRRAARSGSSRRHLSPPARRVSAPVADSVPADQCSPSTPSAHPDPVLATLRRPAPRRSESQRSSMNRNAKAMNLNVFRCRVVRWAAGRGMWESSSEGASWIVGSDGCVGSARSRGWSRSWGGRRSGCRDRCGVPVGAQRGGSAGRRSRTDGGERDCPLSGE